MPHDHLITVDVNETSCRIGCPDEYARHRDTLGWVCHHGSLEILFDKNGTPFDVARFTARANDRTLPLAVVRDGAESRGYDYTVNVTLPTNEVCSKDPQVIIDSGTSLSQTIASIALVAIGAALMVFGISKIAKLSR